MVNIKGREISTPAFFKIVYLILLITAFFYVRSVLDVDSFRATEKAPQKPVVKVREVSVKLTVETANGSTDYTAKLKNIDTVKDFLLELRKTQDFYYEADLYVYGTEIVSVFGKEAGSNKKWAILLNDKDITANITNEYLIDKTKYTLKEIIQ